MTWSFRGCLLDICSAANLITFSLLQLPILEKGKSKSKERQRVHLGPVFFGNIQMTFGSTVSRHNNVETSVQLKGAYQSPTTVEVCLQSEQHLFQQFVAGGYAVNRVSCNQRSVTMQGLKQLDDRQHMRLGDTYSRNMAHGV